MAIAKMSHVRLVGLKRDQNRILDILTEKGLFEARATDCVKCEEAQSGDTELYRKLKLKQSKVSFALDFLKAQHSALPEDMRDKAKSAAKVKYGGSRTLITRADFSDAAAKEYDLMNVCDELEKISFEIVDCKSRLHELNGEIAAYEPFAPAKIRLSELKRRDNIIINVFGCHGGLPRKELLDGLPCAYEYRRNERDVVLVTVCTEKNADEVVKQLAAAGLVRCPFTDDCTAEQKISALSGEASDVQQSIYAAIKRALLYEKYVTELKILYDVFALDIERAVAAEKFARTDSAFVLEGWLPEAVAQETVAKAESECGSVYVQLLAPEQKDAPPTLVVNPAVIKPYEQITDMYSSPRYREIDPNPIMAVFYFLFFGIMIGDAGYGLLLAIAGFVVGTSKKFDTGIKKLALLVGMGGVSAIIWGVLFGGYFSIDFGETNVAIILNPLDKPLLLLVLSIGLGCVQMVTGYVIKFVALCKEGKPFSAIFDCGSIILLFAALVCLAIGMLPSLAPMLGITVDFVPPQGFTTAAMVLALAGVALILIFGGRASKNVFGKIVGGFKGLYGLVNLLSDLLSYCRLFGLCLASCAIGLAFNSLGSIIMGIPVVGYVIGGVVLAVLHLFNLALGVLSAYVHDARLQFLEFYGKFYDGGGRLFDPLGVKTKYIRFA